MFFADVLRKKEGEKGDGSFAQSTREKIGVALALNLRCSYRTRFIIR